jgi:hypothetical protein
MLLLLCKSSITVEMGAAYLAYISRYFESAWFSSMYSHFSYMRSIPEVMWHGLFQDLCSFGVVTIRLYLTYPIFGRSEKDIYLICLFRPLWFKEILKEFYKISILRDFIRYVGFETLGGFPGPFCAQFQRKISVQEPPGKYLV